MDILKLDHTFVAAAEQETRALRSVDGVVRMAHAIGLEVVAEGVERPEQRDLMMRAGCDFRQGYLIGHPLEAGAVSHWLAEHIGSDERQQPSHRVRSGVLSLVPARRTRAPGPR